MRLRDNQEATDAWTDYADSVSTPRLDDVGALPRPSGLGETYDQRQFHSAGEEQRQLWSADGERAARPYVAQTRGLDQAVAAAESALADATATLKTTKADVEHAKRLLDPYVRRDRFAPYRYWAGWVFLGLGDCAGVSGAAITMGEVPALAMGQAASIAFAAVTSGQFGADLKNQRLARQRQRDPESLSADELRYLQLFVGAEAGASIMRLVGSICLLVVLIVAGAVFSLRLSVEGMTSGMGFAALALSTALASAISTYSYADEVADLIATKAKRAHQAERRHRRLASTACFRVHARAEATAASIVEEYRLRGEAAAWHLDALSWRVQARNPQIYGHGFGTDAPGVIGRRPRRGSHA